MLLRIDDIQTFYGAIQALKGISFTVNQGEIVTLIGANGVGKTTTLHTISGILHPVPRDNYLRRQADLHHTSA